MNLKSDDRMKNQVYRVLLAICPVLLYQPSFSQCTPAPPAVNVCGGGNGAASNGQNINTGETYWFTGGPTTFGSGVNLNGGTLRVCGNLTLSAINFNSGRIIIESGGSLTINTGGDISFNGNASITNRGSFSTNHGIRMQNANNRIWNDATTAYLSIAGTLEFNSNSSKFINRGIANIHDIFVQGSSLAGAVCLEGGAIINLTSLINNYTGSFAYNGTGAPACVSVSSSAQLNNNVASSSLIAVCAATGITYSGGGNWGSATVTNNCTSSCSILLADELLSFNAFAEAGKNRLQWITADNSPASSVFYIEASPDGVVFHTLGSVHGSTDKSIYTFYDEQTTATQYYRIQQITPGGRNGYSQVVAVRSGVLPALLVFPNPLPPATAVTFIVRATANGPARLSLVDINGRTVMQKNILLASGSNRFDWNISAAGAGLYIARIEGASAAILYSRPLVITK